MNKHMQALHVETYFSEVDKTQAGVRDASVCIIQYSCGEENRVFIDPGQIELLVSWLLEARAELSSHAVSQSPKNVKQSRTASNGPAC